MSAPQRVVVLGASGFLGSAVVRALAADPGVRVRAVSRRPVELPGDLAGRVEVVAADLARGDALARAVAGADAVLPFAARIRGASGWRLSPDDTEAERVNVGLVRDLVALLAERAPGGAGRPPAIVFPGSNTQVGRVAAERIDGSEPDRPEGTYDRQKHAAETLLKEAAAAGLARAVSLRLPPVYGPPSPTAEDRGVVSTMIRRALAGEPLTMWHDGTVRRDLLYVEDAARAFTTALAHADRLTGRHFLVGTGRARPLGEVFGAVARAVSRRTGAAAVPVVSVEPPANADATDFRSLEVDPSAFTSATGWRARIALDEALDRTVAAVAATTAPRS
ncbi:NAD-dependent epimerase/dehydratase family protein [Streptomyces sp. TBY4]|uniref:NAD-dependent epimerase/dehydratase family protein n=1 Tax=Streptomyces sp. TBY4 TaxID=2962030 RepID=UPI0020B82DAE|nr:NAD-dependent epimerase/dehydratase family protein [Streptomyces sp. TBY4]MCP3759038.1 NAD-dependent epimerase/dehydratase family protein [Streptomyces sp. TBY4]